MQLKQLFTFIATSVCGNHRNHCFCRLKEKFYFKLKSMLTRFVLVTYVNDISDLLIRF